MGVKCGTAARELAPLSLTIERLVSATARCALRRSSSECATGWVAGLEGVEVVVEGGVKGFGIVWSSDITSSSSSLGAWMDFERSSRVSSVTGVVTSAATGGGAEVGVAGLPGLVVSLGMGWRWGLWLGVGVGGKDSVSMDSPSSIRTLGGKYCEPERFGLGSGWRVPIGDGRALTLAALAEDWSFISADGGLGCFRSRWGVLYSDVFACIFWYGSIVMGRVWVVRCCSSYVCGQCVRRGYYVPVGEHSFRLSDKRCIGGYEVRTG